MIEEQMNEMAEAFLRWPLPDDVCADAVACKAGAPHRTGTNLLTAHQALAMIRFVCRPELTSMYADVERLRADHERLTAWIDDLQSGMYVNCVYCGHRYGPSETTPVSMSDALKAHVEQCPQHPMSALRAELAALRAENEALRDDCSRLASYNAEESAHLRTRAEKAEANYRFMVERAADEKLDGYRELGSKCAALEERAEKAEAERDDALVAVKAMHKLLDRDWAIVDRDITLRCESHDQAWNYLHEMRDLVRAALENVVPYKEPQP